MPCEAMCVCRRKNLLTKRSHAASGLHLSSVPSQAKLVQFSCVRKSLFSEPEVSSIWSSHQMMQHIFPSHSFTCAGMLPVQYSKFSRFAGLGVLGTSYISHGNFRSMFSEFLHVDG